jgi:hypothetical protein
MPKTNRGANRMMGTIGSFFIHIRAVVNNVLRRMIVTTLAVVSVPPQSQISYLYYSYLILGSITTNSRSTSKLIATTPNAVIMAIACTMG